MVFAVLPVPGHWKYNSCRGFFWGRGVLLPRDRGGAAGGYLPVQVTPGMRGRMPGLLN